MKKRKFPTGVMKSVAKEVLVAASIIVGLFIIISIVIGIVNLIHPLWIF